MSSHNAICKQVNYKWSSLMLSQLQIMIVVYISNLSSQIVKPILGSFTFMIYDDDDNNIV